MLVVDYSVDWSSVFRGSGVRVVQTQWRCLELRWEGGQLVADCEGEGEEAQSSAQRTQRTVVNPAAVLVRNFPIGLRGEHYRAHCMALALSRVPCVNSALCVLATADRPLLYNALLTVQAKLGANVFPLIPFDFYCNSKGHGRGFEPKKRAPDEKTVMKGM